MDWIFDGSEGLYGDRRKRLLFYERYLAEVKGVSGGICGLPEYVEFSVLSTGETLNFGVFNDRLKNLLDIANSGDLIGREFLVYVQGLPRRVVAIEPLDFSCDCNTADKSLQETSSLVLGIQEFDN